jgi:hypothetical protein
MGDDSSASYLPEAMRGLDSIDGYRLRLMTLRTRILTNRPRETGILRRRSRTDQADTVARFMAALPSPLPVRPGGPPEPIVDPEDPDPLAAAGRAVDAAMILLECDSLDEIYPGHVSMLAGIGSSVPAVDGGGAVELDEPTVGLLVATILGTLEAVSERLLPVPEDRHVGRP